MSLLITNAQIITEDAIIPRGWLAVKEGRIDAYSAGDVTSEGVTAENDERQIDAKGHILAPGFIDIHVHGGGGYEAMDATEESLRALAQFYARYGVTRFLPTTWTATHAEIMAALHVIAELTGKDTGGAMIAGAHVEGPYLNPARCGAQDPALIRRADKHEVDEILATGVIRLMAVAPEYDENLWLIETCAAQNITVSAAHTDATYADMQRAVSHGVTQTTHTFNAMRGLHHREPGMVGAALTMDELRCEVIPDPNHLHPAVVKVLFNAKGADKTIIITDAVRGAGMPEGTTYTQNDRPVVIENNVAKLDDGTLAGSALTMDMAVRNFVAFTEQPFTSLWRCASLTPAAAIGISEQTGSIAPGKMADLVLLDADLQVMTTIVSGKVVYEKEQVHVSS